MSSSPSPEILQIADGHRTSIWLTIVSIVVFLVCFILMILTLTLSTYVSNMATSTTHGIATGVTLCISFASVWFYRFFSEPSEFPLKAKTANVLFWFIIFASLAIIGIAAIASYFNHNVVPMILTVTMVVGSLLLIWFSKRLRKYYVGYLQPTSPSTMMTFLPSPPPPPSLPLLPLSPLPSSFSPLPMQQQQQQSYSIQPQQQPSSSSSVAPMTVNISFPR
jgi:flagellar basal body-associated protein FliL